MHHIVLDALSCAVLCKRLKRHALFKLGRHVFGPRLERRVFKFLLSGMVSARICQNKMDMPWFEAARVTLMLGFTLWDSSVCLSCSCFSYMCSCYLVIVSLIIYNNIHYYIVHKQNVKYVFLSLSSVLEVKRYESVAVFSENHRVISLNPKKQF